MRDFLGGAPVAVLAKLIVACLVVGWAMSYFGVTPGEVAAQIAAFAHGLWEDGFAALGRIFDYILIGAVVVIPLFLLRRLFAPRRGGKGWRPPD